MTTENKSDDYYLFDYKFQTSSDFFDALGPVQLVAMHVSDFEKMSIADQSAYIGACFLIRKMREKMEKIAENKKFLQMTPKERNEHINSVVLGCKEVQNV